MVNITGIATKEQDHKDHYFWQEFFEGVTSVLNFDVPPDLANYKWRITGGRDITYVNKDVLYTSFLDPSNQDLYVDLEEFLYRTHGSWRNCE